MKIAFLDCFSGISGDMLLGAQVSAGLNVEALREELRKLPLRGYDLEAIECTRAGLRATKVNVVVDEKAHHHRGLSHIVGLVRASGLASSVQDRSIAIFTALAEAEAKVHGVAVEQVHFHEVGAMDSIVDIVGSAVGLHLLGVECIYASPPNLGSGTVSTAHGTLPVPAPATLELLKGVPAYSSEIGRELTTPTGAAILATCVDEFRNLPPMKIEAVGCGAGSAEIEGYPNILRLILGERRGATEQDLVTIVETNIDDMNPEFYDHLMARLLAAGALDCYLTPIIMKKNRPATKLTVLAELANLEALGRIIFEETSTFGIRMHEARRQKLRRGWKEVTTPYGIVRVKVGWIAERIMHYAPESDDCRRIAEEKGIALQTVYDAAKRAAARVLGEET